MQTFEMKADRREGLGSRISRRIRREGRLPAILCGKGSESLALHVSVADFELARKKHARIVMLQLDGKSEAAVVHDVAWDTLTQEPLHVDFQRVNMSEKIEIDVTLKVRGPSKGEVGGGILILQMDAVKVRCLPLEIPEQIEVDVRHLELHQSIHVKEIVLPAGVEAVDDLGALVLSIVEKKELVVAVTGVAEAAAVEPELIQKAPKSEDGEGTAAAPAAATKEGSAKEGKEKKPEKK